MSKAVVERREPLALPHLPFRVPMTLSPPPSTRSILTIARRLTNISNMFKAYTQKEDAKGSGAPAVAAIQDAPALPPRTTAAKGKVRTGVYEAGAAAATATQKGKDESVVAAATPVKKPMRVAAGTGSAAKKASGYVFVYIHLYLYVRTRSHALASTHAHTHTHTHTREGPPTYVCMHVQDSCVCVCVFNHWG
jgi:hypothetical protein